MEEQIKKLQKQVDYLMQRRIDQLDIVPRAIKARHLTDKAIVFDVEANLPDDNTSGVFAFFAVDTNKLYCHNGSAWVSITLS